MLLEEGTKQIGYPFYIPFCPRSGLPKFFASLGFKTGAEIGVYKGKFCEKFCFAGIKMYAIDNWLGNETIPQDRQDYLYNYTKGVLRRAGNSEVMRANSLDAVQQFAPESLDFVYIDADHGLEGISKDLAAWYKIVRPGGIISGHDYAYTGSDARATAEFVKTCFVKQALDSFTEEFNITNYYTFGRSKSIEIESKNDRYLSWLFFKPPQNETTNRV